MEFREYHLKEIIYLYDKNRKPLSSLIRNKMKKIYPYYGANGIIDYVDNYIFEGKYILLAEDGTVLNKNLYPVIHKVDGKFWVSNHAHIFKAKENIVLQDYLYYNLKNKDISSLITGAVQLKLNQDNMNNIILKIPDIDIQKKVSTILSDIDLKIEVNNKITDNLLEIRNLIYRRWFIDFEFPNKISKGQITDDLPEGWKYGKINDIAKELKQRIKDDYENAVVMSPVKTGELVKSDDFFNKQVYSKEINNYKKINYLDFAYNPARVNIGSIGILKNRLIGAVSPVYVTFRAKEKYHWYLSMLIKDKDVQNKIIQYSSGSVRQALKYIDFSNIECIVPDENTIEKFNEFYEEIENKIIHNLKQNEILTSTRDTLLPKLMNGEVDLENIKI